MKVIVDTSIWISHFKSSHSELVYLLEADLVVIHDFIIGELACGNFAKRKEIMNLLEMLPRCIVASQTEVLTLIERHKIFSKGIGFIDTHLLASALISNCKILTLDKALARLAVNLRCSFQ